MNFLGVEIGEGKSPFYVAELSQNYKTFDEFMGLADACKNAGADAIKLQALVPDDMTLDCDMPDFICNDPTWAGRKLYDMYRGNIPLKDLFSYCASIDIPIFASVFGPKSLEMCEAIDCPAYKISSFEANWPDFIKTVRSTGKPLVVSLGFNSGTMLEPEDIVLHCVNAYPCPLPGMNLQRITQLKDTYKYVGLSDHSYSFNSFDAAPMATVLGACMIEKHISMLTEGLDAAFSSSPSDLEDMIRLCNRAHNAVFGGTGKTEEPFKQYRRSIYVAERIQRGEVFTASNVRVIRPSYGMAPIHYSSVLGRRAVVDLEFGTPLSEGDVEW